VSNVAFCLNKINFTLKGENYADRFFFVLSRVTFNIDRSTVIILIVKKIIVKNTVSRIRLDYVPS